MHGEHVSVVAREHDRVAVPQVDRLSIDDADAAAAGADADADADVRSGRQATGPRSQRPAPTRGVTLTGPTDADDGDAEEHEREQDAADVRERVVNPDGSTPWWYPYGFLDPHTAGYASAFTYIGGILFAFVLLGIAIIGIGRARERRTSRHDASTRPRIGGLPA